MACGITSDYIYRKLISAQNESENGLDLTCALLNEENNINETGARGDQEEVKGGADGR